MSQDGPSETCYYFTGHSRFTGKNMISAKLPKTSKVLLSTLILFAPVRLAMAATYTAASCNQSDVNAVVSTAADGDTINIPANSGGSPCTWTTGITVPAGIGISIIGAGQGVTTITDNISGGSLFYFQPTQGNFLSRLSGMTLTPANGTPGPNYAPPIEFAGSCTALGCPNIRVDHITFPSGWSGNVDPSDAMIVSDQVFGVIDHNTVTATTSNYIELINVNFSAWLSASGAWGDYSMMAPDTLGSEKAIYIEDNTLSGYALGVETEAGVTFNREGGARVVGRFNTFTNAYANGFANHGTETDGRPRSSRQFEIYGNTFQCANTNNGCGMGGFRGGVDLQFGNTMTAEPNTWFDSYMGLTTERTYRPTNWGLCDGTGAFDINDGATSPWSGTIASVGSGTVSVSGSPWSTGAFNFSSGTPGSHYYVVFDETNGDIAGIESNTTSQLTLSWTGGGFNSQPFTAGDSIEILGSSLYGAGTVTGTSDQDTLVDSSKTTWTTNQWYTPGDAYSLLDVTQGTASQIYASTVNSISIYSNRYPYWTFSNGDEYAILRATKCFDSVSLYGGSLMSGDPPAPLSQFETLDPSYEFADTGTAPLHGFVGADNLNIIADRNYYAEVSASPQTSPTSPFNGTTGTGFGTLANRPTSCTTGVGYWATDQGNWNKSGNGFGQGEFFVCTATNTWSLYYVPYTYPNPLTTITPSAPSNLRVVSHS